MMPALATRPVSARPAPSLSWRETFPGAGRDLSAVAPDGREVGRVFRHDMGRDRGRWFWAVYDLAEGAGLDTSASGTVAAEEPARAQVEGAFTRWLGARA